MDSLNELRPIFLKFKKLTTLDESEGTKSRWAGVITLSSDLFWYIFHRKLADVFFAEEG